MRAAISSINDFVMLASNSLEPPVYSLKFLSSWLKLLSYFYIWIAAHGTTLFQIQLPMNSSDKVVTFCHAPVTFLYVNEKEIYCRKFQKQCEKEADQRQSN